MDVQIGITEITASAEISETVINCEVIFNTGNDVVVPTKTSDLQNDGANGTNPFITAEDVDLTPYQPITDPTLETVAQTIPSAINEVRNIAIGANKAFVFDTEVAMEAWLLIPENVALLITGNLLLIRELTVPDYWWDGDNALELEVKIDLTNYYTKLESDNRYSQLTHRHTGETITPDVILITKVFTQAEIDLLAAGSFFWDDVNQTYAFKTLDGGTIQINQEPHGYYTNLEGAAIVQMNVVSTTGASGNRTAIMLTDTTDDLLANACIGMVTVPSINDNNVGRITKSGGKVNELNTDVVGWVEGDVLYVNPLVKGTLTNVMPVAPDRIIKVGTLLVKHANVGVIDLQIQVMPKLNELVDGELTAIVDTDEYLVKEVATGIWKRFTHSKLVTKLMSVFFTKTQTEQKYVAQNGGTIYYNTKWFTPTALQTLTINANGTQATLNSGTSFTSAMNGAKLRVVGSESDPIITYISTTVINLSPALDSSLFGQVVAFGDWSVHSYGVKPEDASGYFRFYSPQGALLFGHDFGTGGLRATSIYSFLGFFTNMDIKLSNASKILASSTSAYTGAIDIGLMRNAAGVWEINNGTGGQYRDLILRYLYQKGTYAEIHVHDEITSQAIPTGTTYTKITEFTDNGESSNCTADAANDKITITKTGRYRIDSSFNFQCDANNVIWRIAPFLGGVEQENIHVKRKISTAGDVGSASFCGFINVASVPVDIDVRARHDNVGSVGIVMEYANFNVQYIGE